MEQLYFDGMVICGNVSFLDLFVTFTCNPCWSEIQRLLELMHLKVLGCPAIVSRIFKIKFEQFLSNVTKRHMFGKVVACKSFCMLPKKLIWIVIKILNHTTLLTLIFVVFFSYMYIIEFQKLRQPHAHLLLFLHPSNKYPSSDEIDKIIST